MPFVRFSRDRRGYEHVYLVDAKEHGRSRVLYWFRTPPGVRVGRPPFDIFTQRSLEQQYPDVTFDWPQIVAARMPPPAPVENWREKRRAERAFKRTRAEEAAEASELEKLPTAEPARDGSEPLSAEGDSVELDDEAGIELDLDVSIEGGDPSQNVAAGSLPSPPVSGTRRKRRRRRRGRRPDGPAAAAGQAPGPDSTLDPTDPAEKPSKEG